MDDFRIDRKKRHLLIDIIAITIAATLCGIEGYDEIEDFGNEKKHGLVPFYRFRTVSHRMILSIGYFQKWIRQSSNDVSGIGLTVCSMAIKGNLSVLTGKP